MPEGLSLSLEPILEDEAGGETGGFRAVVRNDGAAPVTLAMDGRLVGLQVRAGRVRARCPSPQPLDPPDLHGAGILTVPPGATAAVDVDLRYHCWDAVDRLRRAAQDGTVDVSATYRVVLADPELLEPIGRAGDLAASAVLPLPPDEPGGGEATVAGGEAQPLVVGAAKVDAEAGADVALRVTVRNRGRATVKLVDHPTQFRFEVSGPTGAWSCGMEPVRIAPLPELLVRLRAGRTYVRRLELARYCPAETFGKPGVYRVVPIYDPYLAERTAERVVDREVRGAAVPVRVRRGGD
jgi:hypothetical protein